MHLASGLSFRDSRTRCRKSCFGPGLNVLRVEILSDVEAIHRSGAAPDAGEIRLAVGGSRSGRRQVRLAVGQTRNAGRLVVEPLRGGGCRQERRQDDDDERTGHDEIS